MFILLLCFPPVLILLMSAKVNHDWNTAADLVTHTHTQKTVSNIHSSGAGHLFSLRQGSLGLELTWVADH